MNNILMQHIVVLKPGVITLADSLKNYPELLNEYLRILCIPCLSSICALKRNDLRTMNAECLDYALTSRPNVFQFTIRWVFDDASDANAVENGLADYLRRYPAMLGKHNDRIESYRLFTRED